MLKTFIACKILNRKWNIIQILLILIKYMKALATKKSCTQERDVDHAFMFPYKGLFHIGELFSLQIQHRTQIKQIHMYYLRSVCSMHISSTLKFLFYTDFSLLH